MYGKVSESSRFKFCRSIIFVLMYVLCFCAFLIRRSVSIGTMGVASSFNIGIGVYSSLGIMYYIVSLFGSLFGGILSDKSDSRLILPVIIGCSALFSCGMIGFEILYHIGMINFDAVIMYMYTVWIVSALAQSMIFVICMKLLSFWYPSKLRIYFMSGWFTYKELGSIFSTLLIVSMIRTLNPEMIFLVPAFVGVFICIISFILLRDKPNEKLLSLDSESIVDENTSFLYRINKYVLFNKSIWLLSLASLCIFILNHGPMDFLRIHFNDNKLNLLSPSFIKNFLIPICGLIGVLAVPLISEKVLKGNRKLALLMYIGFGFLCMTNIWLIEKFSFIIPGLFIYCIKMILLLFLIMSLYGSVVLVNMIVVSLVPKSVVSTAVGFVASISYIGSIIVILSNKLTRQFSIDSLMGIWGLLYLVALVLMSVFYKRSKK